MIMIFILLNKKEIYDVYERPNLIHTFSNPARKMLKKCPIIANMTEATFLLSGLNNH